MVSKQLTLCAMSIKAYKIDVENAGFDEDADDKTATEIALGLAF